MLYKGALQGEDAHTVWIGDVRIRPTATGTDTYELNRNLVLTDGARADSVPNLEIETGEIVGAGHASATGRFDDEQLFYLCSRGIDAETARRLVVRGFFADVVAADRAARAAGPAHGLDRGAPRRAAGAGRAAGRGRLRWPSSGSARSPTCPRTGRCGSSWPTSTSPSCSSRASVYACEDVCSHAEVPLSEGDVEEIDGAPTIECWLHGSRFDLRTGEPTDLPATEPVSVYPVRVEGEDVLRRHRVVDGALPIAASS